MRIRAWGGRVGRTEVVRRGGNVKGDGGKRTDKSVLQNALPPNTCTQGHSFVPRVVWCGVVDEFRGLIASRALECPRGATFDRDFFERSLRDGKNQFRSNSTGRPRLASVAKPLECRAASTIAFFSKRRGEAWRSAFFFVKVLSNVCAAFTPPSRPAPARARRAAGPRCLARACASTPSPPGPR